MKKLTNRLIFALCLLAFRSSEAQNVYTLKQALDLCEKNYPLIDQNEVYDKIRDLKVDDAKKLWWPNLQLNGQATYQSQVTSINIPIPGFEGKELPKDQYKIYLDASQNIYDGGVSKAKQEMAAADHVLNYRKNAVDIYAVKQQVIQYFMNILLLDKNITVYDLSLADLNEILKKTETLYAHEVVLRSNVSEVKSRMIEVEQRKLEAQNSRRTMIGNLALLCNMSFEEQAAYIVNGNYRETEGFARPEYDLFTGTKESLDSKYALSRASDRPKVGLFLQLGYGRPGLNMLASDFQPYYIGGLRFAYPLTHLYTGYNERKEIQLQKLLIDNQKEILDKNLQMQLKQYQNDAEKYEKLIILDNKNIAELEDIVRINKALYDHQSLTVDEYTKSMNRLEQARVNKAIHETGLQFSKIYQSYIKGSL